MSRFTELTKSHMALSATSSGVRWSSKVVCTQLPNTPIKPARRGRMKCANGSLARRPRPWSRWRPTAFIPGTSPPNGRESSSTGCERCCPLGRELALTASPSASIKALLEKEKYFDARANDQHMEVGGTDGRLGFAGCALPVVLSHNTPNNAVYLLWGPEQFEYSGLFPRVVRHKDF